MITLNNVSISFSGEELFNKVSFLINKDTKIGLVGKNGAGKSTLLKMICDLEQIDSGEIAKVKGVTIGYLPQELNNNSDLTIWEEALKGCSRIEKIKNNLNKLNIELVDRTDYDSDSYSGLIDTITRLQEEFTLLGGDKIEGKVEQVLGGLGFERDEFNKKYADLSGGWKMRVELVKILLEAPDVLLLDEPTNHLDIQSIQWLERFLRSYTGGIVMISHDRSFLDGLVNKTIEIANKQIYEYKGNYSKFLFQREERIELLKRSKENQEREIADTEKFIERFRYKASKSKQVQSRVKQLDKIDKIEVDEIDESNMNIKFPEAPHSGKVVLKAENLKKQFGEKIVLNGIDFDLVRGEKIALLGKNGQGKSTLIKLITGEYEGEGTLELGHNVKMAYYAQNQADLLNFEKTVFETIDDVAQGDARKNIRGLLGSFLFSNDDVEKKVKVLSGGEKARLALCKMMLSPTNFLILDEPTNHLDIPSKQILKKSIESYTGTVMIVSHDRDFLTGLTEKVFELKSGDIKQMHGDVSMYLDLLDSEINLEKKASTPKEGESSTSQGKDRYEKKKELDREYRKVKNRISKAEAEIAALEMDQKSLEDKVAEGDTGNDIFDKLKEIQDSLEQKLEGWEVDSERMEILEEERSNI